jgi:hypothetical protein
MRIHHQSHLEENVKRRGQLIKMLLIHFLLALFAAPQGALNGKTLAQSPLATVTRSQKEKPKPAVPKEDETLNAVSSQDRSGLSLPKALLGHWVIENDESHMYYREGVFSSVFSGKVQEVKYTLEDVNESKRTMRLRISSVHSRLLTFSEDKKSFVDAPEVAGIKATPEQSFHWKFVDDSRKPAPEVVQTTQDNEPGVGATTVNIITVEDPQPELIIGDSRTKIFYWRDCPEYEKLPRNGRVYFKNKRDAQSAGYHAAKDCPEK